jgi:K+-transporting ATPase KdpF subunit
MTLADGVFLAIAILLIVYLTYALLRGERL